MAGKHRRKKRKILKSFLVLAAFIISISAAVAITWALLTAQTETKSNVFSGTEGITVKLEENSWDTPTASPYKNGEKLAENYSPKQEIPKDPRLVNTTQRKDGYENDSKEYVALRLTYQIKRKGIDGSGSEVASQYYWETVSYSKFKKLADVYVDGSGTAGFNVVKDTDNDNEKKKKWYPKKEASGDFAPEGSKENTIFYYGSAIDGEKIGDTSNITTTLFDYVKINPALASDTYFECDSTSTGDGAHCKYKMVDANKIIEKSIHQGLIGFRIVVEGFAVQAFENGEDITLDGNDAIGSQNAKDALDALMDKHAAPQNVVEITPAP